MVAVSVVICTYSEQRWPQLVAAVESVRRQSQPAAELIIVVDHNAALEERVRRAYADAKVVANDQLRGASGGKNAGTSVARGEVIAFLDDDAVAEPEWLAQLCAPFAESSVLGVGGMAIPAWAGSNVRWFPAEFYWVVGCSYAGLPKVNAPVRNLIGCNMAFRAESLRVLGGFRQELGRVGTQPMAAEETEFCIRLKNRWPDALLLYEPRARVRHHVPSARSTWQYFRQRCYCEGVSKAHVARLVGVRAGLAEERRYSLKVLPAAALRAAAQGVVRGDGAALARSAAIVAGLGFTTAGYVAGVAARGFSRSSPAASTGADKLSAVATAAASELQQ